MAFAYLFWRLFQRFDEFGSGLLTKIGTLRQELIECIHGCLLHLVVLLMVFELATKQQGEYYSTHSVLTGSSGSVADPDPGSCAFMAPGSGILCLYGTWIGDPVSFWYLDPGSGLRCSGSQIDIFESLVIIVWIKSTTYGYKIYLSFVAVVGSGTRVRIRDPTSEIRDPRSGIRDG